MIGIVDYGLGNVLAFATLYHRLGIPARIVRSAEELQGATRLILPGVGAFDHAISQFDASGMRGEVTRLVREEGRPVLGVCVGMQMLADSSEEGQLGGLGWIPGRVRKLDVSRISHRTQLPHMGWNDVLPANATELLQGLENPARFYFLHSYYFECADSSCVLAQTSYGIDFSCAVGRGNVFGVQFHPEKSHHSGVQLLKNFATMN